MKPKSLASIAALTLLATTSCDRKPDEAMAKQIAELERKTQETLERNRQLEQENQEQKLAAERDAIERERMLIEEERIKLEQQKSEDAAQAEQQLREREVSLAAREGKVEQLQSSLEQQQDEIARRGAELSDQDRDLAGREALVSDAEQQVSRAPVGDYSTFYDSLSSYGSWFESPDYGYVWQPVVVRDTGWRPYSRGRWACSDRGWIWVSDEPFGWACYHYGRWCLLRGRGWVWVPGSEWAPAWVTWRSGGDHVGWAPLPPETLAYRGHRWDTTVEASFGIGALWFNFVETRNFGRPIHHHCLPYTQNNIYINQSVNITNIHIHNNQVICGGPRYRDFQNRGVPFYRLDLDHHRRPGRDGLAMASSIRGDRLRIAAPEMNVDWNDGLRPSRVRGRLDNVVAERPEALRPEIVEGFRKDRDRRRNEAEQAITKIGGFDRLHKVRAEQFEQNRRDLEEQSKNIAAAREARKNDGKSDRKPDGPKFDDRDLRDRKLREEAQREQMEAAKREQAARDAMKNDGKPDRKPDGPKFDDRDLRDRKLREEAQREQMEAAKREQAAREAMKNDGKPDRKPDGPKFDDRDLRDRKLREEAQREQQAAANREQQEAAKREQMERAREQQAAANREQLEAAKREQMERAREQQEAARREQQEAARREQMERAREQQEAARREQQEAARREQMERAREQQESARREQQEAARREQQESARREQQEAARREQQERAREEGKRDRGGFR